MVHNTYPTLKPRLVAYPTLKPRLVEHADGHTDFFFGMYLLETRFARIIYHSRFMFKAERPLYFRQFRRDETAETDLSDQRGRRKTAELELHTSGAKRAETWRGGVKW